MSRWVEESGIEFRLRETKKKHNLVKHAQRHGRITAASHKPPSASPATCSFRNRQGLLAMDGPQTWQEVAVPKVKSKWMVNSTVKSQSSLGLLPACACSGCLVRGSAPLY